MCLLVYLGSDESLPTIAYEVSNQPFSIALLRDHQLRALLTKRHVYAAFCWHGCGCGFFWDLAWKNECNSEAFARSDESVQQLQSYVSEALENSGGEIEILAFWSSTEDKKTQERQLGPEEITIELFRPAWYDDVIQRLFVTQQSNSSSN